MPAARPRGLRRLAHWRPGATASHRSSVALGVLLVLVCVVATAASELVSSENAQAQASATAAHLYQEARFDVARQDADLNEYLLTGDESARSEYEDDSTLLAQTLHRIAGEGTEPAVAQVLNEQSEYTATANQLLAMLAAGRTEQAADFQRYEAEPILIEMTGDLGALEQARTDRSSAQLAAVRLHARWLQVGTPSVLGLVVLLLAGLALVARAYRRRIADQAVHDALTGLPNRTLFASRAAAALGRQHADPAVIMLDLDRFKEVNDTLGHHQGDQLLIQVAQRIGTVVQASDTVSRLGGDEFAVLVTGGGPARGADVATRIARALEPPFYLDGVTVSVEASMGIATRGRDEAERLDDPDDPADCAAQLLRQADIAMYEAKLERCTFAHFRDGSDGTPPARLALLGELREALNRDELVLHYQPKVGADSGQLLGVEALVRWNHPTRGLLAPGEFIGLAERTTLIQRLTTIVIDKALATSRDWLDRGVRMPVAVNVSARCLLDRDFPQTVQAQLEQAGLPADHLCLELTESTIMADPDRALAVLRELRELGVRLSVDDFGTGYSSMAYLKILPVDELKVDRSFVSQMSENADDTMLVQSAIDLGHNLGLSVVAEGVEDHQTLVALRDLGADVIQGYYLGRPMDAVRLETWMGERYPLAADATV